MAAQNDVGSNHGNSGICKFDLMVREWWVLFPLESENTVKAFLDTILDRKHGGFLRHNALTLGREMEVTFLSCWLLSPSQPISLWAHGGCLCRTWTWTLASLMKGQS